MRQEKYDDSNAVVALLIRRFFARVGMALEELAPATLLDAGCGEGEMLRRGVIPAATRATLLDLRADSAAHVRASVTALPFAARAFDVVTCMEVLEHLAGPGAAYRELARVARRAVVLSVPHEPWFRAGNLARGKHLAHWGNHPEHVQHWSPRSFAAFLRAQGAEPRIVPAFPWIIAVCRVPH